jgi:glycosyltransferase involved in cell wall biosynthesis
VVYAGQYIPLHGLETVVDAAHRLRDREDIVFDLVGRGQALPAIRERARALHLPNLRFSETWLSPEGLADAHLASADICLGIFGDQPKAQRVVPYKVYTALASGRPVITADTPAIRELLAPGAEVWTVPPADPEALATAILALAEQPHLRRALARAGQAAWDARFAPEVVGAKLRAALETVVRQER